MILCEAKDMRASQSNKEVTVITEKRVPAPNVSGNSNPKKLMHE